MQEIEDNTVPFNMALFFYNELHKIRKNKVLCLLNNNIEEYYWCLDQIFVYLSFKLKEKEYTDIDDDLKKHHRKIANFVITPEKFKNQELFNLKIGLRELDVKLNKYMHKYGYLFPKFKSPEGFAGLAKKMGISMDG